MHTNRLHYLNNKAFVLLHNAAIWKLKAAVGECAVFRRTPEAQKPRGCRYSSTKCLSCHFLCLIFYDNFLVLEVISQQNAQSFQVSNTMGFMLFHYIFPTSKSHSLVSYYPVKWLSINFSSFSHVFSHQHHLLWLEGSHFVLKTNNLWTQAFFSTRCQKTYLKLLITFSLWSFLSTYFVGLVQLSLFIYPWRTQNRDIDTFSYSTDEIL